MKNKCTQNDYSILILTHLHSQNWLVNSTSGCIDLVYQVSAIFYGKSVDFRDVDCLLSIHE